MGNPGKTGLVLDRHSFFMCCSSFRVFANRRSTCPGLSSKESEKTLKAGRSLSRMLQGCLAHSKAF